MVRFKQVIIFIFLSFSLYGQENYYLIDTTNLDILNLSKEDSTLLDETLDKYHKAIEDTSRLRCIFELSDYLYSDEVWPKYNDLLQKLAEEYLNKKNKKQAELDLFNEYLATAYNNKGYLQNYLGNIELAIENYFLAINIYEKIDADDGIGTTLNNIAMIYYSQEDYLKALEISEEALELRKSTNNKKGEALTLQNIGHIYDELGDDEKEMYYYQESLKVSEEIGDVAGSRHAIHSIGAIYSEQGKVDLSLEFFEKSLKINKEIGDVAGTANALYAIGNLYMRKKKVSIAKKYAEESYKIANEVGFPEKIMHAAELLNDVYSEERNWKDAYKMYNISIIMRDSLKNENLNNKIFQKQIQFDYEKKEQEIKHTHEKELAVAVEREKLAEESEKRQKLFVYAIGVGLVLVLLIAIVILRGFFQKKKANLKLEEINTELDKLSIVAREVDNAVIIADKNGHLEWVNESFTRLFGYTLQEFIEENGSNVITASKNPKIKGIIESCMENKEVVQYTVENLTKSGEKKWVQTTVTPILDDTGEINKIVFIDADVSKMKEVEVKLFEQKNELEISSNMITESLDYAKRIQHSVLPSEEDIVKEFPNSFRFFQPKDIVSGDFYWMHNHGDTVLFAAADCTGHGVPGAFMSIISTNILNSIVSKDVIVPKLILEQMGDLLIKSLRQSKSEHSIKDGLDIALCSYNKKTKQLLYSGAHNSIYFVHKGELTEYKADRNHIGISGGMDDTFTNHEIQVESGDVLYLFSDGFPDQKGGPKGKKFYYPPFRELLEEISSKHPDDQQQILTSTMHTWKKDREQIDDMLIWGIQF